MSRSKQLAAEALDASRREGRMELIDSITDNALGRLSAALESASESHPYNSRTGEFQFDSGGRWHTPGSLAVYTLLGENNRELAAALDLLVEFGIQHAPELQASRVER